MWIFLGVVVFFVALISAFLIWWEWQMRGVRTEHDIATVNYSAELLRQERKKRRQERRDRQH